MKEVSFLGKLGIFRSFELRLALFQCPGSFDTSEPICLDTEIHMTVQNVMEGGHNHLSQLGTWKSNSQATGKMGFEILGSELVVQFRGKT